MAGDGEGATALFTVKVIHAATKEQAVTLSKSVITSNLTKAAIFGHDANWGRILCAMGYSGAPFDPEKVDLTFTSAAGSLQIIENGVALDYSEEEARRRARDEELDKERRMQEATLSVQNKFGKNALLKGMNLEEGATTRERNEQIGGHKK